MNKLLLVVMAAVLLMFSCNNKKTRTVEPVAVGETTKDSVDRAEDEDSVPTDTLEQMIVQTPMPKVADELFDDFFFNFAASRKLQRERTVFPFPIYRNGKTEYVSQGEWKMDHYFMPQGFYTLIFDEERDMEAVQDTSLNEAVVEKIYFNTGAVQRYHFLRRRGAWMLCEMKTEPLAENRNASFLEFYHRFVTDSTFQAESLHDPVMFSGPDPDDDFARMEGMITADTWPAFAPELPERMLYNIVYGKPGEPHDTRIFLMRGIANGLEIEMSFRNMGGRWLLMKLTT